MEVYFLGPPVFGNYRIHAKKSETKSSYNQSNALFLHLMRALPRTPCMKETETRLQNFACFHKNRSPFWESL